ncbi:MAG: serine hydrolase [Candidatus Thorarchaeota archaeon]
MYNTRILSIILLLLVIPIITVDSLSFAQTSTELDYWPTDEWQTSTLEEQGMKPAILNEMMTKIEENNLIIDSLLIVKNGYMVFEKYPSIVYDQESRHIIHSCTKSFTSALVGIAIEEGYINSVDEKLVDLLPNSTFANYDPRMDDITLEHLLMMTSGLEWDEWSEPYSSPANSHYQYWSASDSVQYVLDLPLAYDPGDVWVYSSGSSHLLSAIVTEATGVSLLDYAEDKLFTSLGISVSDVLWPADNQGIYRGSGGVEMVPRDMAKFGYLYLNNGSWDGEQIVPSAWVQTSSETLTTFDEYSGYSHQWWTYPTEIAEVYSANGYDGQNIFVIPSLDMVVVFTSRTPTYPQLSILFDYVIPAALTVIPQNLIATHTLTLATLVMIPLPILIASVFYQLRIRHTNSKQELIVR